MFTKVIHLPLITKRTKSRRNEKPRKTTLSALTETDKTKSTFPVVKQRMYTGRGVITSSLANTPVPRSAPMVS